MQAELLILQGAAKVILQVEAVDSRRGQTGLEQRAACFATGLGTIQGKIGVTQ